jgi:hypothetical protein
LRGCLIVVVHVVWMKRLLLGNDWSRLSAAEQRFLIARCSVSEMSSVCNLMMGVHVYKLGLFREMYW